MLKGLSIQKVRSSDPQVPVSSTKHTYRTGSNSSEDEIPLSMRFMHKPSRASEELRKASDDTIDVTRRNSLRNAFRSPSADLELDAYSSRASNEIHRIQEGVKLVRKKSGEIVKPLLKETFLSSKNRSLSLPSTPTYKLVHFGGDNDVRYFNMKDKPTAISALNSPQLYPEDDDNSLPDLDDYSSVDELDSADYSAFSLTDSSSANYFDYYDDELNSHIDTPRIRHTKRADAAPYPRHDWKLTLVDFPLLSYHANIVLRSMPVFLENIFLSVDCKYLLGQVAVRNLAYEKRVTVRYTLDSWVTIVEIPCLYVPDVPPVLKAHNYDRFVFKIPLDSFFNGFPRGPTSDDEDQICQICVKFWTPICESWDNNDDKNYLFKLHKVAKESKVAKEGKKVPISTSSGIQSTELPQAAKTKQETHIRKPKYSLSYLKKRNSNTTLLASDSPGPTKTKDESVSSIVDPVPVPPQDGVRSSVPDEKSQADCDFEQNNYYLSSPLFSSLNNNNPGDIGKWNSKFAPLSDFSGRTTISSTSSAPIEDMDENSISPDENIPESPIIPPRNSKEHLKNMSYKELLDSYCFFTTPSEENSSTCTLVLSEEPGRSYEPTSPSDETQKSADPGSVFTVSSLLKN